LIPKRTFLPSTSAPDGLAALTGRIALGLFALTGMVADGLFTLQDSILEITYWTMFFVTARNARLCQVLEATAVIVSFTAHNRCVIHGGRRELAAIGREPP
jgi:hypothetical protein